MDERTPKSEAIDEPIPILIASITVLFIISLQFFFLLEITLFEIILSSLAVFGVVYIIAKCIFSRFSIIRDFMEKKVKMKWLLLVIFIVMIIILVIAVSIENPMEGIEGKAKCILPDGSVVIYDLWEKKSPELECIFPQVSNIPFIETRTFATSGKTKSKFYNTTMDGKKYYTEITFQNFFNSLGSNSGFMILPLNGYDASEFTHLSFWVKGANGGENFGIKIKDKRGTEVNVEVTENYLEDKNVSTHWQKVTIPLEHFLDVDMSALDVISIYSDGKLSYKDSETIYVTGFELY